MLRYLAIVAGALALTACSTFAPQNSGSGNSNGHILLGAHYDGPLTDVETPLGRKLDIVSDYYGWNWTADNLVASLAKAQSRAVMITWEAGTGTVNGQYTCASMADIVAGKYDSQLHVQAAAAKAIPATLLIRLFPEFSNHPAGYNCANPTRNPALYIAAFDHVVTVFRVADVTNVRWVYAPYGGSWINGAAKKFYPGASYVDVLAEDEYNTGLTPENFPADICTAPDATSLGKPLMVTETGAVNAALQTQWLNSVRAVCSNLYAFIYFDADGKNPNGSYVITDPSAFAALKGIGN